MVITSVNLFVSSLLRYISAESEVYEVGNLLAGYCAGVSAVRGEINIGQGEWAY
jgi:hypothetical protein